MSHAIDKDQLIHALNWRYAVKKFDATKKISSTDWHILEESLRLTASSYGLQPWKFIVVQNPDMKKKLTPASYNQPQIETCSHLVVLTTLKKMDESYVDKYIKAIADTRGVPAANLEGFKKVMMGDLVHGPRSQQLQAWAQRQVYIAMGSLLTAAALINVDTTPMEGVDPTKYDEILGLTHSQYATVAVVACGYRAGDDQLQNAKKVRFNKADVIQYI